MTRRLSCIWLALVAATFVAACGGGGDAPSPDANNRAATPGPAPAGDEWPGFFWRIDGPNGPSYVLGTLEYELSLEQDIPRRVYELFRASETGVFEGAEVQPRNLEMIATPPSGTRLDGDMRLTMWAKVVERLSPLVPEDRLRTAKPWFAAMTARKALLPTYDALPSALLKDARQTNKSVRFLSTDPLTRYRTADTVPRQVWLDRLARAINERDAVRREMRDEVKAWREGDLQMMAAIRAANAERYPAHDDIMIRSLNEEWLIEFAFNAQRGSSFAVIDCMHLVGPGNMLERLAEQRGFTVTQMATGKRVKPGSQ